MKRRISAVMCGLLVAALSGGGRAQFDPGAGPTTKPADADNVKILHPVVDNAAGTVTVPGAFWNQRLADWVEVALCGRPSDFLHETLVCATTTRDELEGALRTAGFRDADTWADAVSDFPRVRGDRLLVLIRFTRAGKDETYSLDELLTYQGWSTATGPYGFMFKGDPERSSTKPATAPTAAPTPADEPDSIKILRDDPQIALVFKGLQSMSQSFADHPLAYDDWIYPMMNYGRNFAALPADVFNSNGSVPVTLIFRKVSEEQLLTESANMWHEPGWRDAILKQVPVAKEIDAAKAALMEIRSGPSRKASSDPKDATGAFQRAEALRAKIERGYAALDAAWAAYAADHTKFPQDDPQALSTLKDQAAKWREHLELKKTSTEQRAMVAELYANAGANPLTRGDRGKELVAMSVAGLADNRQPREYWRDQWARLDANDPRTDWLKSVRLQVDLTNARQEAGEAGETLGKFMQADPEETAAEHAAADRYKSATMRIAIGQLQLELVNIEFEIGKRAMFEDDPDLPKLRTRKAELERQLQALAATTRPAPR